MKKEFMVVELPKNNYQYDDVWLQEPAHFEGYQDAFSALNKKVSAHQAQLLKQPKGEVPLRVALADRDVELWVITRTSELVK